MMAIAAMRKWRNECKPRPGDTLVRLSVNPEMELVERMHLLTYSFAKVVQGTTLRQIEKWDLTNGSIEFIVAGGPSNPSPHGRVTTELQDWPVEAEVTPIGRND